MPLEALSIPDNLTDSDSDGIDGGTGCNYIFYVFLRVHSPGHTFGYFWLKFSYVGLLGLMCTFVHDF